MDAHFVSSSGFSRSMQQRFDGKVVFLSKACYVNCFWEVFYLFFREDTLKSFSKDLSLFNILKWKNVMSAINQVKSITGLNQLSLRLGYFLVKNAGSIFLIKRNIVMEVQENLNLFNLCRFKDIWGDVNYWDRIFHPLMDTYLRIRIILVKSQI